MNKNLTKAQFDAAGEPYAYFLPATSGFYSTYIGKQRYSNYVDPARIPASFGPMGIEAMNYLNPNAAFYFDHCLYSAGHANLDCLNLIQVKTCFVIETELPVGY